MASERDLDDIEDDGIQDPDGLSVRVATEKAVAVLDFLHGMSDRDPEWDFDSLARSALVDFLYSAGHHRVAASYCRLYGTDHETARALLGVRQ